MGNLGYLIGIIMIVWFLIASISHVNKNHKLIPFTNLELEKETP